MGGYMKKYLLGLMAPMLLISSFSQAVFIVSTTHKHPKSGQTVMLLGDLHDPQEGSDNQKKLLINELKTLNKKELIIFVEDWKARNNAAKKQLNKLGFYPTTQTESDHCALGGLCENHGKQLPIINLDTRAFSSYLIKDFSQYSPSYYIKSKEFLNSITDEIEQSYKPIYLFEATLKSKQEKQKLIALQTLKTKEIPLIEFALTKNHKAIKQAKQSFKDLKGYIKNNMNKYIHENILFTENSLSKTCCSILDLNFACNILKNSSKKNIVICAGATHTSQLQKFLLKLGYVKTSSTGNDIDYNSIQKDNVNINLWDIVQVPFKHITI